MGKFLDSTGLGILWSKIKEVLSDYAKVDNVYTKTEVNNLIDDNNNADSSTITTDLNVYTQYGLGKDVDLSKIGALNKDEELTAEKFCYLPMNSIGLIQEVMFPQKQSLLNAGIQLEGMSNSFIPKLKITEITLEVPETRHFELYLGFTGSNTPPASADIGYVYTYFKENIPKAIDLDIDSSVAVGTMYTHKLDTPVVIDFTGRNGGGYSNMLQIGFVGATAYVRGDDSDAYHSFIRDNVIAANLSISTLYFETANPVGFISGFTNFTLTFENPIDLDSTQAFNLKRNIYDSIDYSDISNTPDMSEEISKSLAKGYNKTVEELDAAEDISFINKQFLANKLDVSKEVSKKYSDSASALSIEKCFVALGLSRKGLFQKGTPINTVMYFIGDLQIGDNKETMSGDKTILVEATQELRGIVFLYDKYNLNLKNRGWAKAGCVTKNELDALSQEDKESLIHMAASSEIYNKSVFNTITYRVPMSLCSTAFYYTVYSKDGANDMDFQLLVEVDNSLFVPGSINTVYLDSPITFNSTTDGEHLIFGVKGLDFIKGDYSEVSTCIIDEQRYATRTTVGYFPFKVEYSDVEGGRLSEIIDKIGNVDLAPYYTSEQTDTAIQTAISAITNTEENSY